MIKKLVMVFLGAFLFTAVGFSGANACWPEKSIIHLPQYALNGAQLYCMHQAKHARTEDARLRFGEQAKMIGEEGGVSYDIHYDRHKSMFHTEVFNLYLDGIKLNKKLKKEALAKAWRIKQIQKEARANSKQKTT
jgi:hypothetical protein